MLSCPKCQSELDEFKGKLICSNEECDFSVKKADFEQLQRPWYQNLCADENLWYKKVFNEYPSIIAHEYWRLYDLLEKGQTYGAFWQLKDLFEVLLKFPTLIVANTIYAKRERSDAENKLLIALLERLLSLGSWQRIAGKCKKLPSDHPEVVAILQQITSIYDKHVIVNWRNNEIGHGTLRFDADENFQKDIKAKLGLIKEHFETCDAAYAKLSMYLRDGGQKILLKGRDRARNLNYETAEVLLDINGSTQSLAPYILLHDQGIYCFDSFHAHKVRTAILNFPDGIKRERGGHDLPNNLIAELYGIVSKGQKREEIEKSAASLEDETYSALAEETLEKIAAVDDFERPNYLENWLKTAIKTHTKGVFQLQMERGTGKSTFARALDEQSLHKIRIDSCSVRAYYIDSAYRYRVESFTMNVSDRLRQNNEGKIIIQAGQQSLPRISRFSEDPQQDFANLLNFYRRQHHAHFGKEQLLLIIDGLDEIPAQDDMSIFDFLPAPESLDDGVYLLLTCRTKTELTTFTLNKLKQMKLTDSASFKRDENQNNHVLTSYIKKQMQRTNSMEISLLLDKAEHRFLYLKMLKELLVIQGEYAPGELPQGQALFDTFLDHLNSAYGEKFFGGVIRLLAILATAFEALTVQEISYLYGEEKMSFRLLAHLIDLRGFLHVERSYRGNLIAIAHEELKGLVQEKYRQTIHELLEGWIRNCITLTEETVDLDNDGETYLLASVVNYVMQYPGYEDERLFTETFANMIGGVAFEISERFLAEHHRTRRVTLYTEAITIQQRLLVAGRLRNENNLASALTNRGNAYQDLQQPDAALSDYTQAITIRQRLLTAGCLRDENDLASSLINQGNGYRDLQQLDAALSNYTQAITIRQRLLAAGRLRDENDLASAFMNRGVAYSNLQQHDVALSDYTQAITIRQRLLAAGRLLDENDLARALTNRGNGYRDLQQLKAALSDYTQAIMIQQPLLAAGQLLDENDLAKTLLNRGNAYQNLQQLDAALSDYTRAIMIQQRLRADGHLLDENDLAKTLLNRGYAYQNLQQLDAALSDNTQAIMIQQQVLAAGRLLDENDLAMALVNRGNVYRDLQQLEDALADYTQAITIQQRLLAAKRLLDEQDLAKTLLNRGNAYRDLQQLEDALADYTQAITIQQQLLVTGRLLDENALVKAFTNRGNVYWDLQQLENALADYTEAITIQQRLQDENVLAAAFINRGVAYNKMQQLDAALNDYTQAITIRQRLLAAGRLLDENDLAIALMNRGVAYWQMQRVEEALDDVRQALVITRSLLPKRPLLIGSYTKCVCFIIVLMITNERTEALDEVIHELHKTLKQYELTDEARKWLEEIKKLLEET